MATILIVEDRDVDRQYLATLLGYYDHRVVEASDGVQALAQAARHRPDLVISDVLMPKLDGYEFVRQMRSLPDIARTPVIFYTASYHEREAMALARQCGVSDVLIKPSEPDVIVAKIAALLGRSALPEAPLPPTFEQEHLRVVSDKLVDKVRTLEAIEQRLAAVVRLCHRFTSQLDPAAMLDDICEATRETTLAQYAVVALVNGVGDAAAQVVTSGARPPGSPGVEPFPRLIADRILADRAPVRQISADQDRSGARSCLGVPIASALQVYGWIGLVNKLGADGFSEDDEKIAGMIGSHAGVAYENAQLVHQLRQQTATLHASEERTLYALEAGQMGVWELDIAADRVAWSEAMSMLYRTDASEAPATRADVIALVHPDDRGALRAALQHTIDSGKELAIEFRLAAKGSNWIYSRARLVRDEHGRPARLLGVAVDISGRKSLEAQLLQSQKMEAVGQLAGGVAHDFNNLLTAILGYGNLVVDSLGETDSRRDAMGEVVRAAERAATLTRQLLTFSRKHVVQPTTVNLNVLVDGIRDMLGRLIGEDVQFEAALDRGVRLIRADPGQVEQVLMNLVVNARDAMPHGGRLRVETANVELDDTTTFSMPVRPGAYVMLAVRDTGEGMSEETQRRIFEPFFTTKGPGKGTGLGLAMVWGIVKDSGGTISISSEPGAGTNFRVYFPVAEPAQTRPQARSAPETPLNGTETILLVEDEPAIRRLSRVILERAGYTVLDAANPADAEAICLEDPARVDMLLTDVIMPGASGPALFQRLVTHCPGLRVLYVSGYTSDAIAQQGNVQAGFAFLQKPFSSTELKRKVRDVLDR